MKIPCMLFTLLLIAPLAQASLIFQADTNNVSPIVNGVQGTTMQSENLGILTIANVGNGNFNAGIASTDNINTLLGRSLLPTDTVILKLVVDSMTGDLNANGLEFGYSPNNNVFRPVQSLLLQIRPNNTGATIISPAFDPGGAAGFGINEASVLNGFTATFTANQNGFTFSVDDIVLASGTAATYSGTFDSPAQFQSVVGAGHFYVTAQKTPADMNINISEASINVIPEPSSAWLISLGTLVLLRFRRR